LHAYVINLPQSIERRRHIETELAGSAIDARFVRSVDGSALSRAERDRLVDEAAVARFPEWLTEGQIGCALSHLNAYRQIVEAGDHAALVVEDDIRLPHDAVELVTELYEVVGGSEITLLYYRAFGEYRFSSRMGVELNSGRRLLYPLELRGLVCSSAYVVTREAAQRMTEHVLPVRAGADSWAFHHESGALDRLRCVVPRPAGFRHDFKSAIDYLPAGSAAQRAMRTIERRRLPPLYQLLAWRRARSEREMSRFEIVDEPSRLARA
jgi:glycosyl transferase, family 25